MHGENRARINEKFVVIETSIKEINYYINVVYRKCKRTQNCQSFVHRYRLIQSTTFNLTTF